MGPAGADGFGVGVVPPELFEDEPDSGVLVVDEPVPAVFDAPDAELGEEAEGLEELVEPVPGRGMKGSREEPPRC